jgi:hypothetical protein
MVADQVITQVIDGQTEETLQTIGYEYTYTITEVDAAGNMWVDAVYEWALFEQGTSFGTTSYDSANPPEVIPDEAIGFAGLVGKGFSLQFNPQGGILEITGLTEMYAQMIDDLALDDPEIREMLEELMQDQFGEEAISSQMNNVVFKFPDGTINIGDSWTSSSQASALVPMNLENVYTLQSFDGQMANITVHSTVTPSQEGQIIDLGFMQLAYFLEGVQEGTTQVDVLTGWTSSSTITQNLSGEMIVYTEGEEFEVPITLESTTTVETLKE